MNGGENYDPAGKIDRLFQKIEVRLQKSRDEAAGLRWYAKLNPARRGRLSRYEKQLGRARGLWRAGDSAATFDALSRIDRQYPSTIGLVYGTYKARENQKEVYEMQEEASLGRAETPKRIDILPGGFHGGA